MDLWFTEIENLLNAEDDTSKVSWSSLRQLFVDVEMNSGGYSASRFGE